ncbi:MAG: substrate binding domain-containing protein [Deltaproteobacteria bacterium]|nr:substrate binding domain-containing protein [Deltaproteobacteria bacterium]
MRAPAGRVRVSMYADTYHGLLRGAFSAFADRWPDIQVNVTFSEDPAHLMTEPYDVTFRIEPLPDSAMVARKIYTIDPAVYASPKFLERHRAPEEPRDLLDLPCITLARFGNMWELRNRDRVETLYIKPRFVFSSVPLMTELMVGGHGAGLVQRKIALPYLETGRLVQLLPEWNGPRHDLFILTAGRQVPQRVRIFVDFIRDFLETAKTPQPDR